MFGKIKSRIREFFRDQNTPSKVMESKNFALGDFIGKLREYGHNDLADYSSILLYNKTAPVAGSVNLIASKVASLTPVVKTKKSKSNDKEEIVNGHPVIDLLHHPNGLSGFDLFMYSIAALFLISGNSYINATGQVDKEPLEIWPVYPQSVTPQEDPYDGYVGNFLTLCNHRQVTYKRYEKGYRFRFYSGEESELWQIRRFNPNSGSMVGQSIMSSILPQIDWFNSASSHNVSLLKKGARPSGILLASTGKGADGLPIEPLTDDQYMRLKKQLHGYMGEYNAGKPMMFEGANLDWKDLISSNKDMDFIEGIRQSRNMIYSAYDIPLPLIESDRQTFSNLESGGDQLFYNAVLPLANFIFQELNLMLMPRYGDADKLFLTYDDSSIDALKNKKTREIQDKSKTGIYTINELRMFSGMERLDEGGDVLYRPASMIPVAVDQYVIDQYSEPQK